MFADLLTFVCVTMYFHPQTSFVRGHWFSR